MLLKPNAINTNNSRTFKGIFFDLFAAAFIASIFVIMAFGAKQMSANISHYEYFIISLSPKELPYYALMTVLRIFIAVVASLLFTLVVATLAAKSKKAEQIIIPLLDIFQSLPVLGYISFTVTFFVMLFPHNVLGVEIAVIFAIFTAQVWNMTFSLYQSLKILPQDLQEATATFSLSPWQKFWYVELPFAVPNLVWNTMMSVSGSWFFIVASEAISVGDIRYTIPGIGSYLAEAIKSQNIHAIFYAVWAMFIVIVIYDNLLFRPIIVWSEKFKYETISPVEPTTSWVVDLFDKAYFLQRGFAFIKVVLNKFLKSRLFNRQGKQVYDLPDKEKSQRESIMDMLWYLLIFLILIVCLYIVFNFLNNEIAIEEIKHVFLLGFITLFRIVVLVGLATVFWVPIGVYIGLNPQLAKRVQPLIQFLAAFPVNILFPIFVILLIKYKLNANIFLSLLMILGTQWYILFNIIAGAAAFPADLKEAAFSFNIRGWQWWKKVIIPGIFPSLTTGMLTASGGAWNASIVAEAVNWGDVSIHAIGLGSYITEKTVQGDYHHITLGILVMAVYVVFINKVLWRPLYRYSEANMRLG